MALTRITKGVIKPNENYDTHNINSTGIVTATNGIHVGAGISIVGVITATALDINGNGDISGNLSVGGVLTYEDVTSIDSVGLVTARQGVFIPDNKKLEIGNAAGSGDLQLYHDTNHSYIDDAGTGNLKLRSGTLEVSNLAGSKTSAVFNSGSSQDLYFNNTKRFETTNTGAKVTGTLAGASEVGIQSGGVQIGAGITQLNFIGTGNTFAVNGTTVDVSIQGGGGTGAGGTWSSYTAGIATTKSVGVNTNNLDDNDLVGVGNSFQGLYISNGMIIHDNTLNGNHYIGTTMNGLMAGPVNIEGTLTIDGNYVVV